MELEKLIYLSFVAPIFAGLLLLVLRKNLLLQVGLSGFSVLLSAVGTFLGWLKINQCEPLSVIARSFSDEAISSLPRLTFGDIHNAGQVMSDLKPFQAAENFYFDGFSIFMQFMAEFITFFAIIYSYKELQRFFEHRKESFNLYFSVILLSLGFSNLCFSLNSILFVYITLEISSIICAYLICFRQSKESLKAGFKYLLIVNIGILFSLLGIVLLSYFSHEEVLISNISKNVALLSRDIALLCAGLLTIGFFTKAGLMPFHIWLPDSYAEAPTASTVFMTGLITKLGIYGLIRTTSAFALYLDEFKFFIVCLASISMLFGALMAFTQKDVKRMIAYSSISEMGAVTVAIVLNSYTAFFGAVFHMLNHTLMKGALFFSAGLLIYHSSTNTSHQLRASLISIPFFIGALAVGGMPPFSSFSSSITILFALADKGFLWTSAVLAISGFISALALLRFAIKLFWHNSHLSRQIHASVQEFPYSMVICSALVAVLLIVMGIYPKLLYTLLDATVISIMKTMY
ncbi:complex I subunit 5 family protein [Thermodesulfovibrio hydrogeniphilus]